MAYRKRKRNYRRKRPYSRRQAWTRPSPRPYAPRSALEVKRQEFYLGVEGKQNGNIRFLSAGPNGTAATLVIPPTVQKQNGIAPDPANQLTGPIIGATTFRRYMSTKIRLTFPSTRPGTTAGQSNPSNDGVIYEPTEVYVLWGWHQPLHLSEFTQPKSTTIDWQRQEGSTNGALTDEIINRVAPFYGTKENNMIFQKKTDRSFVLEGCRRVRPDRINQIPVPQQLMNVATGHINPPPRVQMNLDWKMGMNRTVYHTHSTGSNAGWYPAHTGFWYPGSGEPLPFVLIFNPEFAKQAVAANTRPEDHPATGQIQFEMAFAEWFNDP